jgi:hypothetical protein
VAIPIYLALSVMAGCISSIAAVIFGLNQALKRANWLVSERRLVVQTTAAVLVGWFAIAVTLASLGAYHTVADGLPTIEFGIVIPILIGALFIWRSSVMSRLIDAIPRHWVIAIQFYRVEGVIFLFLYASKLLPGIFALPAGVGDVVTGLLALSIGINASRHQRIYTRTVLLWNLFGIADLMVALTTGFLTSPSAFQRFAFDNPNQLISMFPLVLVPTFLVPLAILLHIISLIQPGRTAERINTGLEHTIEQVGY